MAPSNRAAFIIEQGKLQVGEAPYPELGPNEIIVKAGAVAFNPVDVYRRDEGMFNPSYPWTFGCDLAGTAVAVGADVKTIKEGDRVMGEGPFFLDNQQKYHTFQEYVVLKVPLVSKIPDNISFEEACVLPVCLDTAAAHIYGPATFDLAMAPSKEGAGKVVVIWGGSSSVGANAVQLAKNAGYEVITTASPHNHALCKELGAAHVLDYKNPKIVDEIVALVGDKPLAGAVDAIFSEDNVMSLIQIVLKTKATKKLVATVRPQIPDEWKTHGVEVVCKFATEISLTNVGPHIWEKYIYNALADGSHKPAPYPKVVGKGLESINDGVNAMAKGVSAQKIVVTL